MPRTDPEAEAHGANGVLTAAWCPEDASILVSGCKDSCLTAWGPDGTRTGALPRADRWVFAVEWASKVPAVLAYGVFGEGIEIVSILDPPTYADASNVAVAQRQPPRWLSVASAVDVGLDGIVASTLPPTEGKFQIRIAAICARVADPERCTDAVELALWKALAAALHDGPRDALKALYGFDADAIVSDAHAYIREGEDVLVGTTPPERPLGDAAGDLVQRPLAVGLLALVGSAEYAEKAG